MDWAVAMLSGGALLGALRVLERLVANILDYRRNQQSVSESLVSVHRAYGELSDCLAHEFRAGHGNQRILLLCARDGHVSCLHSVMSPGCESALHSYTGVRMDEHYRGMLETLEVKGVYRVDMATEPKDSVLHSFYSSEGVLDSVIFWLGKEGLNSFYLSFAAYDGLLVPVQIASFRIRSDAVRSLLRL